MRGTTWGMDTDKHENHWRRTFCQIPFPLIYERAESGKRSLHRLVEFFRRKAEADRTASEELRAMLLTPIDSVTTAVLDDLEEPGSSMRRALSEVKNYVDATCHQQLLLARVLEEQVAEPLMSLQEASEMYIRTLQGEIRNVNDQYNQALGTHDQAAARLRKARDELGEVSERQRVALHGIGVPAFELQRLASRVAKCEDEVAQAELAKAQTKTLLYNRIVARDEMAMAVSVAYQKAEEERLDQLNSCLERFLHIEKERVKAAEKRLGTLETHIKNISRAEDIQLLIHNHRNPDNMHFQGKALALLDWHWNKTLSEQEKRKDRDQGKDATRHREAGTRSELSSEPIVIPQHHFDEVSATSLAEKSPHRALAETPMGRSLHGLFAADSQPNTPTNKSPLPRIVTDIASADGGGEGKESDDATASALVMAVETELGQATEALTPENAEPAAETVTPPAEANAVAECEQAPVLLPALKEIIESTCETQPGRALFVKCLNRQRSLETRVKDQASFDALVECFDIFLDHCLREDDVKAAKTAMILAETFYLARNDTTPAADDDAEQFRRERGSSWGSVHHALGRASARIYLQEQVKKHAIWKNPAFWEKALLLALGEELHRTPQPCAWEDLPSGLSSSRNQSSSGSSDSIAGMGDMQGSSGNGNGGGGGSLYTREEAVSRVHNIVFGQLGSFTLSMLEFDVPFLQIESFVETMCDAHELTEDQRFLLRKNLQEMFATLK